MWMVDILTLTSIVSNIRDILIICDYKVNNKCSIKVYSPKK